MSKIKAEAEARERSAPKQTHQIQFKMPEKISGPSMAAPPNGKPPAGRAADLMTAPGLGSGAGNRARLMRAMQGSVGNARVSRMLGDRVQTKLTIGAPNDVYEQEADRVAEQVLRAPVETKKKPTTKATSPRLQRCPACQGKVRRNEMDEGVLCPECRQRVQDEETVQRQAGGGGLPAVSPETESYLQSTKGGGQPLPEGTRKAAESSLDRDMGEVRVHDDAAANQAAKSLNARAFTHGSDVYLARGESVDDRRLMGHELTHVVQQKYNSQSSNMKSETFISAPINGLVRNTVQRENDEEQYERLLIERLRSLAEVGDPVSLSTELHNSGLTVTSGPEAFQALLEPGRRRYRSLRREAQQLVDTIPYLEQAITSHNRIHRRGKQSFLILLSILSAQAIAVADYVLSDPGDPSALLLHGHYSDRPNEIPGTHELRRIRQLSRSLPTSGLGDNRKLQLIDWSNRVRNLIGQLEDTYFSRDYKEELQIAREYLTDYHDYLEHIVDIPWYMFVPVVNFPGSFFWEPVQQGFQSMGSALFFGPIIIPVLAAYNISLSPHNTVQIVQGKVEAVRALSNPDLSNEERWNIIFQYGSDQLSDIVFAKAREKIPSLEGTPATIGWSQWLVTNRKALLYRIWMDVIKYATGDLVEEVIAGESLAKVLQNLNIVIVKSAINNVLTSNLPDVTTNDELIEQVYKALIKSVSGAVAEQIVSEATNHDNNNE